MNKRIQELAEQSTEKVHGFSYRFGHRTETIFNEEKFAKLIVIECKQILLGLMLESTSDNGAIDFSLTLINDHFGMEDDEPTSCST